MSIRHGRCVRKLASLLIFCVCAAQAENTMDNAPSFDKSGDADTAPPPDTQLKSDTKIKDIDKKAPRSKKAKKAIELHIKNLKDPDPEVRYSSAEMLRMLHPPEAVPDLIEVLNPARSERVRVMMAAHGALVDITGQNFGYKNYNAWNSWWLKNKEDFIKKSQTGVDETRKLAAKVANTLGLELNRQGDYAAAAVQFLEALDKDPTVPDYHCNLGLALRNQGRFVEAMTYFEEAIAINPDLPQPYLDIGMCYSAMNKSIEAQAWFKKAIAKDKEGNYWHSIWMLGREYMKRADWNMAYEFLDQARVKAEKNHLHDPQLHVDLALTHYALDQYHSAWKEICNVRTLGYEPSAGFVAKVRKALLDEGTDPDAEDALARKTLRGQPEEEK